MLILVTGAAGRIGAHLTRKLVGAGHRVRAFVLPQDPRVAAIAALEVEFCYGRLEDAASVAKAARGVDAVYHLAGALTSRGHTDEEFFEVNLRGTFNLLMALRDRAPRLRRFAYASSDAVYDSGGEPAAYLPIDEGHPPRAGSVYGATKIGAEELCLTFWRGFGIPATILRFGATADACELIDPRSVFARWLFLRQAIEWLTSVSTKSAAQDATLEILRGLDNGQEQLVILADPDGHAEVRQWGDARDVADGCMRVLEQPNATGEVFNLGGAAPFSTAELVMYLAAKLDLPYITARIPTSRSPWHISSAKARGMLGHVPQHTVFDMVDAAVAKLAG